MSSTKLTLKQQRFVEAYIGEAHGNATKSARIAGYTGSDTTLAVTGRDNLRKPHILQAIDDAQEALREKIPQKLTPEHIHKIWFEIATDPNASEAARLKALSDAARSNAMYVDRVRSEVTSEVTLKINLPQPKKLGSDGE